MRIFVLEDDQERIKWFAESFKDHSLVIANHADAAMAILRSMKFSVLFLDHDLGGKVYVSSDAFNTGSTVAKMIDETQNKNAAIVIHSHNAPAAIGMEKILRDSGHTSELVRIPFGQFDKGIIRGGA